MADVVTRKKRSEMMAGIRGKDTRPELFIRKRLHARGFRYRLHDKKIPGKPDMVFARYKAIIFVHGCFWHRHDCHLFKWPKTRQDFWTKKINGNLKRDKDNIVRLKDAGWRVLVVWECALKGKHRLDPDSLMKRIVLWLDSGRKSGEIKGRR